MKKVIVGLIATFLSFQVVACAAITKKGTQCKRAPSPGSQYCWQHGGTTKAQRAAGMTEEDVAKARCKAITKAGTQCRRTAQEGNDFCWQHIGNAKPVAKPVDAIPIESTLNGRCDAITKKGTRCTRKAQPGTTKCWQHQ